MIFLLISILAGVLTVLAPCILPLLPIVIGSTEVDGVDTRDTSSREVDQNSKSVIPSRIGKSGISKKSLVVIGSLSVSVIVFTLLLKATTLLIDIPQTFWNIFSGSIIIIVGLAILFPSTWSRIPLLQKLSVASNKSLGSGYQKKNYYGDMVIGLSLGPVFTTCSPTYLFIIATILPAGFIVGLIYLLGFTLGLAFSLLLIAYFGQRLVNAIVARMGTADKIKKGFGILILVVGIGILTGYDKKLEAWILDSGYGATIEFEERLIRQITDKR